LRVCQYYYDGQGSRQEPNASLFFLGQENKDMNRASAHECVSAFVGLVLFSCRKAWRRKPQGSNQQRLDYTERGV